MIGGQTKRTASLQWEAVNPWLLAAVLVATVDVVFWISALRQGFVWPAQGLDFATYRGAGQSFLDGTGFYQPQQLAGPYPLWGSGQPILYPPQAIPLFAAFTVLPWFLWWAVPLGVLAWKMRAMPLPRLLLVAGLIAYPQTIVGLETGNPAMWMAAFLALGLSPLVLLKPTLAPFALIGVRDRRWWIGLAIMAVLTVAFLPLIPDYLVALSNARGGDLFYLAGNVPLMVAAWIVRTPAR